MDLEITEHGPRLIPFRECPVCRGTVTFYYSEERGSMPVSAVCAGVGGPCGWSCAFGDEA